MLRADVQPPVCQRPGPAHRQQRSEDPSRLRAMARHARLGQPAGEEPGPQVGDAGGDALGPPGAGREPGPAERGHPLRRQPAERRDGPLARETGPRPVPERGLAVVPRRPAERLHHALHHHRLRPPAAPGREARHAAGLQVAGPAGRLDRRDLPRDPPQRSQGREPPQSDDRALPLRPQLLPRGPADHPAGQGGGGLLPRPGPEVLAQAGRPPVAGPPGRGPEAVRRQAGRPGHHAVDQGAVRQRRRAGHVLARHRALVLVVSGPDRDPGHDDRGLRRGDGRPEGGRGLQGLAVEAEADAGLEDHQGHGRRRLRPAAARQQRAGLRRAGRGDPGRQADQAREGRGRHRLLRAEVRPRRDQARDGPDHA